MGKTSTAVAAVLVGISVLIMFLILLRFCVNLCRRFFDKRYRPAPLGRELMLWSIAVFLAIWSLRYAVGLKMICNGGYDLNKVEEIGNSFVHALQSFSMDEDYTEYIASGKEMIVDVLGEGADIYGVYASALNIIAPILGGAIVFNLLANIFPKFWMRFSFLCFWRKKYFFSELNETSVALAQDIRNACGMSPAIIFTDVYVDSDSDEKKAELLLAAKRFGAICVRDDIEHITARIFGEREYYLMDADENANLQALIALTEGKSVRQVKNSVIYFFVQSDAYVQVEKRIHKSFNDEKKQKLLRGGKKPTLIPVNGYRNLVQNLFDDVPLYEPLIGQKDRNDLKVTIFGNGQIGTEAFLNAYWIGQMMVNDCKTPCIPTFNILSKDDANAFWGKIDYINPEIKKTAGPKPSVCKIPYCRVNYQQADVKSGNWQDIEELLNSDYYIIALGSDSDNIAIAEKLRCLIGEECIKKSRKVVIAYAVFDPELANALNKQKKFSVCQSGECNIYMHAFGNIDDIYCCRNIYMTKYTNWSRQIGNAYSASQKVVDIAANQKRTDEASNYNYWADLARAEHTQYKVFSLGWIEQSVFDTEKDSVHYEYIDNLCNTFRKCSVIKRSKCADKNVTVEKDKLAGELAIKDKWDDLQRKAEHLAWLEHRRWCAFTRVLGYRSIDVKSIKNAIGTHKDMRMKLHACLVDVPHSEAADYKYIAKGSDPLDEVEHVMKKEFKKYDYYDEELNYEFKSVLRSELKDRGVENPDKYLADDAFSSPINFGHEYVAVSVDEVNDALPGVRLR